MLYLFGWDVSYYCIIAFVKLLHSVLQYVIMPYVWNEQYDKQHDQDQKRYLRSHQRGGYSDESQNSKRYGDYQMYESFMLEKCNLYHQITIPPLIFLVGMILFHKP